MNKVFFYANSSTLSYRNFVGSVEFRPKSKTYYGKLIRKNSNFGPHSIEMTDLVTYTASSLEQLKMEFKLAVDDYIQTLDDLIEGKYK